MLFTRNSALSVFTGLVSLLATLQCSQALDPAGWKSQSIYQVLTDRFARSDLSTTATCDPLYGLYCGGTWQGLVKKLDYIQGMGFTAVWISPFVKNIEGNSMDGSAYHGYWAQDITQVNSNFGTGDDLKALSKALHDRGMYLMVDVVTNHFGYLGCSHCVNYTSLTPFNSQSYFHPPCFIDYNNATSVRLCWEGDDIVALPDLRTEDQDVRTIFNKWISNAVTTYGIDGLRLDSAQQVESGFWPPFQKAAGGIHALAEVFLGDPAVVTPYQQNITGLLNYPTFFQINQTFASPNGNVAALVNVINTMSSTAGDISLYGSFLENHDNPRFPSVTQDMALVKNAIAFTMLMDGIPIIYQGQEQFFKGAVTPLNREALWLSNYNTTSQLYGFIKQLNNIRSRAISQDPKGYLATKAYPAWSDGHNIVLKKGTAAAQIVGLYTNVGSSSGSSGGGGGGSSNTVNLAAATTEFTAGQVVVDVLSCTSYTADGNGGVQITTKGGLPVVLYPAARLSGSGICATTNAAPPPTGTCTGGTVPITFGVQVQTTYGTSVKIVGSVPALGSWDTTKAVALDASQYTTANPLWQGTVTLPAQTSVGYKFIKVNGTSVVWEADPNRLLSVPCVAEGVKATWQAA